MRKVLFSLLISLLALPAFGQVTTTGMTYEGVTIAAATASTPAPDWTSNFIAVYDFEASGDPWANQGDTSAGANCDASIDSGTPTRETGDFYYVKNTAGAYIEDAGGEADRLIVGCSEIEVDAGDISMGGWFYYEQDSYSNAWGRIVSNIGSRLSRDDGDDSLRWQVGNGTSADLHETNTSTFPAATWVHVACWFDYSASEADCYINGGSDGVATSTSYTGGSDRNTAYIGDTNGADDQRIDEVYKISAVLDAGASARIAACGIDGADCSCNGTAWVTYGKTDESCTGSGAPWECCTGSGTGCVDQDLLTDDCNQAAP